MLDGVFHLFIVVHHAKGFLMVFVIEEAIDAVFHVRKYYLLVYNMQKQEHHQMADCSTNFTTAHRILYVSKV